MSRLPVIVIVALLLAPLAWGQSIEPAARAYRKAHGAAILSEFRDLLSIPNHGRDTENIFRNAEYLRQQFARRGVEMQLLSLPGQPDVPPLIYGRIDSPGATRTIGIYVHYDGQPADASKWTNAPFEAVLYTRSIEDGGKRREFPEAGETIDPEWRLYGRSTGDDKAPLIALLTALDALAASDIAMTSNIRFMFEGEEEMGSPHLGQYFEQYDEKFSDVDVWLICDGPVHQSRRPQIVFGVRGITSLRITVYGASRYLHSGHYGNFAPNPAMMLSQLLASMKDEQGNVLIKGYYDSVEPLSAREQAALDAVPDIDDQLREEFGLAASENNNESYLSRLLLPSLNIKGLESATAGPTARNVIPTTATVAIDMRLVKGNDPRDMLDLVEAHIREQGYHIVREEPDRKTRLTYPRIAKVTRGSGYRAARTSMDLPIVESLVRAANRASDEEVILMPSLGGSLPLYLFEEMLGTPTIIVPMANHDDNQHAPDENIRIANLWYGIDLLGEILTMRP